MWAMIKNLIRELSRRGVLRAVGAYIAIVWLLAQGVVDIFPAVGIPEWIPKLFVIVAVAATPLIAIVSWKYDLTKKGFLPDKRGGAWLAVGESPAHGAPTQRSGSGVAIDPGIMHVTWTDQHGQPQERMFISRFVVGRDYGADVRLFDSRVSRRHLQVYPEADGWLVEDLKSSNGSYIDGVSFEVQRIEREACISLDKDGPRITLARKVAEPTHLSSQDN